MPLLTAAALKMRMPSIGRCQKETGCSIPRVFTAVLFKFRV